MTEHLEVLLRGGVVTLQISVLSWILSTVVGLLLAIAGRSRPRPVRGMVDFLCVCLRGMPQLVFLYLVYYGLGQFGISVPALAAAIFALGITEAGYSSEVFRASFATVSGRTLDSAASLGMSPRQMFRYVEFPLLIRFATPPLLNTFVSLLKLSTFASAIGVSEMIFNGHTRIAFTGDIVGVGLTLMTLYLIFTIPITRAVASTEQRMRKVMA